MRPPATDTVEKPLPSPVAFQTRRGPAAGQSFSSPISAEMPSRFGPRHCGQSPAAAAPKLSTDRKTTKPARYAGNECRGDFINTARIVANRIMDCKQIRLAASALFVVLSRRIARFEQDFPRRKLTAEART